MSRPKWMKKSFFLSLRERECVRKLYKPSFHLCHSLLILYSFPPTLRHCLHPSVCSFDTNADTRHALGACAICDTCMKWTVTWPATNNIVDVFHPLDLCFPHLTSFSSVRMRWGIVPDTGGLDVTWTACRVLPARVAHGSRYPGIQTKQLRQQLIVVCNQAMLCYATLGYALLCYAWLCLAMLSTRVMPTCLMFSLPWPPL